MPQSTRAVPKRPPGDGPADVQFVEPVRGLLVVWGWGLRVHVEGGQLICLWGLAEERYAARVSRIDGLRRLVVLGARGTISTSALAWLHQVGAALLVLDHDADELASNAPQREDARLRRAQVAAGSTETGIEITRLLLAGKLSAQLELLGELPTDTGQAQNALRMALRLTSTVASRPALRRVEADAGAAYWSAWRDLPLRWLNPQTVPEHWRTVGRRVSVLTEKPKRAVTPWMASLNLLYSVLETEATFACRSIGLDPGLGFLHSDAASRPSLALDVMEPVRPVVDRMMLDTMRWESRRMRTARLWRRENYRELPDGQVRLSEAHAASLLKRGLGRPMMFVLRERLAPWVELVAERLVADAPSSSKPLPMLLTGSRRRAAGLRGPTTLA